MIYQDGLIIEINMETVDIFKLRVALIWCSFLYGMELSKNSLVSHFLYKVNLSNLFEVQSCAES